MTLDEALHVLGHEVVNHAGGTAGVLPYKGTSHPWCVQALVRAIVATGDAKIILWSDNG